MIPQLSSISSLEKASVNSPEYKEWLEKAGRIDTAKLVKKTGTDKNGKKYTRWVRPGDAATLDGKGKAGAGTEGMSTMQAREDSQLNTAGPGDTGLKRGRPRTGASQRDSVLNPTGRQNPAQVPQINAASDASRQTPAQDQAQTQAQDPYAQANATAIAQLNVAKQAIADELTDFKSQNADAMEARETSKFNQGLAEVRRSRESRQTDADHDRMNAANERYLANNGDLADWFDSFSEAETSNSTITKDQILRSIFSTSGTYGSKVYGALNKFECTDDDFAAAADELDFGGKMTAEAFAQERQLEQSGLPTMSLMNIRAKYKPVGSGSESEVFATQTPSGERMVLKVTDWSALSDTPADFMMSHVYLHNAIFPDTKYTIAGLTRNEEGRLCPILRQKMYAGVHPSTGQLAAYMRAKGFHQVGRSWVDSTGTIRVEDVRSGNAIRTPDGQIHIFDPSISMQSTERYKDANGLVVHPKTPLGKLFDRGGSIDSAFISDGLKTLGNTGDVMALFNLASKQSSTDTALGYNGAFQMGQIIRSGLVKIQKGKLSDTLDLDRASAVHYPNDIRYSEDGNYIVNDQVTMHSNGRDSFVSPSNSLATAAAWNQLFPNHPVQFAGIQSGKDYGALEATVKNHIFNQMIGSAVMIFYSLIFTHKNINGTAPSFSELRSWMASKGLSESFDKNLKPADGSYQLPALSPANYVKTPDGEIVPRMQCLSLDFDGAIAAKPAISPTAIKGSQQREAFNDFLNGHSDSGTAYGHKFTLSPDKKQVVMDDGATSIDLPPKHADGYYDPNSRDYKQFWAHVEAATGD